MEVDELAKAISAMAPRVPLSVALWSPDDVADYLRVGRRTVVESLAHQPGFPPPQASPWISPAALAGYGRYQVGHKDRTAMSKWWASEEGSNTGGVSDDRGLGIRWEPQ